MKDEGSFPLFMSMKKMDRETDPSSHGFQGDKRVRSIEPRRGREQPSHVFSRRNNGRESPKKTPIFKGELYHSQSSPTMSKRNMECDWCHKSGHTEERCWAKQKRCLACGDANHWMSDCSKVRGHPLKDGNGRTSPRRSSLNY